jgi:hypothetical protein
MMNDINNKFKKFPAYILLCGYVTFLTIASFHHHHFCINDNSHLFIDNQSRGENNSDLVNDFVSFCALHQFTSTILGIHDSPGEFIEPLQKINTLQSASNLTSYFRNIFNEISPRAPPSFF